MSPGRSTRQWKQYCPKSAYRERSIRRLYNGVFADPRSVRLLALIVALCLFASGRTGLLLHVAMATGVVGSLFVAAFYEGKARAFATTQQPEPRNGAL
jgi:hypothetical protein